MEASKLRMKRELSLCSLRALAFDPRPMSDQFDVRYVAQLARLDLAEEEITKFQAQLGQVLSHVEQLSKLDVSAVEPTAHANAVHNVFRVDQAREWFTPEVALSNAPRSANGLFIVPKVIE
jgi:aspartyl-tRNA(Asn)/glutamyl-tRNA(Gln) amidotransferase subunit C